MYVQPLLSLQVEGRHGTRTVLEMHKQFVAAPTSNPGAQLPSTGSLSSLSGAAAATLTAGTTTTASGTSIAVGSPPTAQSSLLTGGASSGVPSSASPALPPRPVALSVSKNAAPATAEHAYWLEFDYPLNVLLSFAIACAVFSHLHIDPE